MKIVGSAVPARACFGGCENVNLKTLALARDSNWGHQGKFTSGSGLLSAECSALIFPSNRQKS